MNDIGRKIKRADITYLHHRSCCDDITTEARKCVRKEVLEFDIDTVYQPSDGLCICIDLGRERAPLLVPVSTFFVLAEMHNLTLLDIETLKSAGI